MDPVPTSVFLAPVFLVFEGLQLVAAEKLLGIKQIESGLVERDKVPGDNVAAWWSLGIISEAAWCLWLLCNDVTRVHAGCILLISLFGFSTRNSCKLKWVLVVMTIEGACRMGFMVSMLGSAWRNL